MPYSQRNKNPYDKNHAENILSVSGLNSMARSLLESNFPAVIVEGEISNLAVPSSGHWYLTLKDKSSQIRCAMFVNRNRMVRFKPENGKQIIVRGRLSIYEGRGDYQLILDGMEEAGDGALQRAFEQLKRKLHDEGLFADENKQQMQSHYQHIGVITSATGAAVQDILSVFARRFPATRITLLPVVVQGAGAANEIVNAIERANALAEKLGLQALIVGRGGGSLEDLQAFNEEPLARAISASELPICSAVGHEVDFTIADFVADLRAPTPSAAAELLSPNQEDYFDLLFSTSAQFKSAI
ncbi:MAG: exodeoxyribonuclease VII large subunit, partial [Pseudomonadales bacterium]